MTDKEHKDLIRDLELYSDIEESSLHRRAAETIKELLVEREERSKPVKLKYTGFDEIYCPWGNCPVCGAENIMDNKFYGGCFDYYASDGGYSSWECYEKGEDE